MKARLWNTLEHALPWTSRGNRSILGRLEGTSPFSTTSTLCTPRDAARQMESDLLKPSRSTSSDSTSNSGKGVLGVREILGVMDNSQRSEQGQTSYMEGLRQRQENLYTPYGNRNPPYNLHVYSHKHNTIMTLTRPNGNPILSVGCGTMGFRKSQRGGYDPAFQLSSHLFAQIQEKGLLRDITALTVVFRGFGFGREAFTKVLLGNEGRHIRPLVTRVTDATRIKFGGTRSRAVRRLG